MPTASYVKADFSSVSYCKDEFNAAFSNFLLKTILFEK